jgi:hypothetical protein
MEFAEVKRSYCPAGGGPAEELEDSVSPEDEPSTLELERGAAPLEEFKGIPVSLDEPGGIETSLELERKISPSLEENISFKDDDNALFCEEELLLKESEESPEFSIALSLPQPKNIMRAKTAENKNTFFISASS